MVAIDVVLENYTIEKEIGRGDLTIVYRGIRKSDETPVAVKVVAPQFTFDEVFVKRFKDITRQTIKLEHPHIARTYEVDQEGSTLFAIRSWIDARPLSEILEIEGPCSPHRMVNIARQIAAALDYAHQKSIMHGDLSAKRIYIGPDDQVIVADFGQAQAMAGTSLAKQGYAVGSPEIVAPERVHGQGASRQSDLYSLGILCYQMLNQHPPFNGEPAAVLHAQAYEQPQPLHTLNPGVSVPLSEAISRMLSKGLELRYTTGAEFTRALTVATEGTAPIRRVKAGPDGEVEVSLRSSTPLWRRPWVWGLAAGTLAAILLGIGFLIVSIWLRWQPASQQSAPPVFAAQPLQVEPFLSSSQVAPSPAFDSVVLVEPTATVAPLSRATPLPTLTPTAIPPTASPTPTLEPIPTPGPPTIVGDSPFTNLKLAHAISQDGQPEKIGTYFEPGNEPIYLFFDYANIEAGADWTHRWVWGNEELDVYEDIWPGNYFETGTAWVFYRPVGGFQPGPYKVTLEVEGQVKAIATFVIQEGGL